MVLVDRREGGFGGGFVGGGLGCLGRFRDGRGWGRILLMMGGGLRGFGREGGSRGDRARCVYVGVVGRRVLRSWLIAH